MWPEAVTWFARGLGAVRENRIDDARVVASRLNALESAAGLAGEELFARNIRILRLEAEAWLAHAERDTDSSIRLMRQAIDLELATPKHAVTPGPTLPAWELLGDLFMEQARPVDALAAYTRSLELYPRRFNSLLGAARAARAAGDETLARSWYQALLDVAAGGSRAAVLGEARAHVGRQR
jgi:tetratricopeptide (TPR) repeat protein